MHFACLFYFQIYASYYIKDAEKTTMMILHKDLLTLTYMIS